MDRAEYFASRHLSTQSQRGRRQRDSGQAGQHPRRSRVSREDQSGGGGGRATSPRRLVDHPGLLMVAYQKFSDAMQSQIRAASTPKPAKAPKAGLIEAAALGGLGALGGAERKIQNSAPPIPALDRALAIWGEAEEERAAIVEYDGNITHAWAEGFARLHPDRPPGDVSR